MSHIPFMPPQFHTHNKPHIPDAAGKPAAKKDTKAHAADVAKPPSAAKKVAPAPAPSAPSFQLSASVQNVPLGTTGSILQELQFTLKGYRAVIPDSSGPFTVVTDPNSTNDTQVSSPGYGPWEYTAEVTAQLAFSGMGAAVTVSGKLHHDGGLTLAMSNVPLHPGLDIVAGKLEIPGSNSSAPTTLSAELLFEAGGLSHTFNASGDYSSRSWGLSGELRDWVIPIGSTRITLSQVLFTASGTTATPPNSQATVTGEFTARCLYATAAWRSSLKFNSTQPLDGLVIHLSESAPITLSNLIDAAKGGSSDHSPAPTSLLSRLQTTGANTRIVLGDRPLLLADATWQTQNKAQVSGMLSLHSESGGFGWALAMQTAGVFLFTDFLDNVGGVPFNSLALTSGYAVVVGGVALSRVPLIQLPQFPNLPLSVSAGPGVLFGCSAQVEQLVPRNAKNKGTPLIAQVSGSFSASATKMALQGKVSGVPLFDGGTIQSATASITVVNGIGTVAISGVLLVDLSGSPSLALDFTGSFYHNVSYEEATLQMQADSWSLFPHVNITKLSAELSMKRYAAASQATGNVPVGKNANLEAPASVTTPHPQVSWKSFKPWEIKGNIYGQVTLFHTQPVMPFFTANIPLPVQAGQETANLAIPSLHITPGVYLDNVEIQVSGLGGNISGVVVVDSPYGDKLTLDVQGSFTETAVTLAGGVSTWQPVDHVKVRGLKVLVTGSRRAGTSDTFSYSAMVTGTAEVLGMSFSLSTALPFGTQGGLNFTGAGIPLGHGATFEGMLQLRSQSPKVVLLGKVAIPTGVSQQSTVVIEASAVVESSSSIQINGQLDAWTLPNKAVIRRVQVTLDCALGSGSTNCTGVVYGQFSLGAVATLDVEIKVPLAGGVTARMPKLRLTEDVYLRDIDVSVSTSTASLSGKVDVTYPGGAPFIANVAGTVRNGCFDLSVSAANWNLFKVGTRQYTLTKTKMTMKACGPSQANTTNTTTAQIKHEKQVSGSLSGSLNFGGQALSGSLSLPPGAGSVLTLSWSSSAPSFKVSQLASSAGAETTTVANSYAAKTMTAAQVKSLNMKVAFSPPRLVFGGLIDFGTLADIDFEMHIVEGKAGDWGFAAFLMNERETTMSSIIPDSTFDSILGNIQKSYVVVTSHAANVTVPWGTHAGTVVSTQGAGAAFGAKLSLSSIGGGRATHVQGVFNQPEALIMGEWSEDPGNTSWFMTGSLKDLSLAENVVLENAKLQIRSVEPMFTVHGTAVVQLPNKHFNDMTVEADVTIQNENSFFITGSLTDYNLTFGSQGVNIQTATIGMSVTEGVFAGSFQGKAVFGSGGPTGTPSASSEYKGKPQSAGGKPCLGDDGFPAACAFDDDPDTIWDSCCEGYPTQWLEYTYDTPQKVTSYAFTMADGECPTSWVFQGSGDLQQWSDLDSQGHPDAGAVSASGNSTTRFECGPDFQKLSFRVSKPGVYRAYRWMFQSGSRPVNNPNANGYRLREVTMEVQSQTEPLYQILLPGQTCHSVRMVALSSEECANAPVLPPGTTVTNASGSQRSLLPPGCSIANQQTPSFNGNSFSSASGLGSSSNLVCRTPTLGETAADLYLDLSTSGLVINFTFQGSHVTPNWIQNTMTTKKPGAGQPPAKMRSSMGRQILGAQLLLNTSAPSLEVSGQLYFGSFAESVDIFLRIGKSDDDWGFAFGVKLEGEFGLDKVNPGTTTPSYLKPFDGVFLISTFKTEVSFQGTKVTDGLVLECKLPLKGGPLDGIGNMTGIDEVKAEFEFGLLTDSVDLKVEMDVSWWLAKPTVKITQADFFLKSGPNIAGGFEIGLGVTVEATVHDHLMVFGGEFIVSDVAIEMEVSLDSPWTSAFGINSLTLDEISLSVAVSYEGVPTEIGFTIAWALGNTQGSGVIELDLLEPEDNVFAGSLSYFNLGDLYKSMTGSTSALQTSLEQVSLRNLKWSVNPMPEGVTIENTVYPSGSHFSVGQFQFFALNGSAKVIASDKAVYVNAVIQPFELVGGKLKVHGAPLSATTAPMTLTIQSGGAAELFEFSGSCEFMGESLSLQATVSEKAMDFNLSLNLFSGAVRGMVDVSIEHNQKSDTVLFDVSFSVEAIGYLMREVEGYVLNFVQGVRNNQADLQYQVNDWNTNVGQPFIAANNRKIAQYTSEDEADLNSVQSDLRAAQQRVNSLQSSVNYWKQEASDNRDYSCGCHWYSPHCCWEEGWHRVRAVYDSGRAASDQAVIWTATQALNALKGTVSEAEQKVSLDPRILTLEAANKVLEVGLSKLNAGLQDVSKGLRELASFTHTNVPSPYLEYGSTYPEGRSFVSAKCGAAAVLQNGEIRVYSPASKVGDSSALVWTKSVNCGSFTSWGLADNGQVYVSGGSCGWTAIGGTAWDGGISATLDDSCLVKLSGADGQQLWESTGWSSGTASCVANPPGECAPNPGPSFFKLTEMGCKGNTGHNGQIKCTLKGSFKGTAFDLKADVSFPPTLEDLLSAVIDSIKNQISSL
eukprot:Hpha_TRINITY_DN16245_c2_g7::TRINITY_DN16245_c2_g7_i3::g.11859::m.11859